MKHDKETTLDWTWEEENEDGELIEKNATVSVFYDAYFNHYEIEILAGDEIPESEEEYLLDSVAYPE